jgi:DNA-binding CsgD family transcriptional regulator
MPGTSPSVSGFQPATKRSPSTLSPPPTLTSDDARRLLAAITGPAIQGSDLAEKRRLTFEALLEVAHADAGHWAWGRGNPLTSTVAPLAVIHRGYEPDQLTALVEHALDPVSMRDFQVRAWELLAGRSHSGWSRRELIADARWAEPHWQSYVSRFGFDSFAHAVNYHSDDTWSCIHLVRRIGAEEFGPREAAIADLALSGVSWMNALVEERVPPETFVNLTPRQRTVMLMLLDGKPRKEIAGQLGISEYTVDDHLKALYAHFGVRSASELAARFLRMA